MYNKSNHEWSEKRENRIHCSYLEFPEFLVVVAVAQVEVGELALERRDQQQLAAVRRPQRARLVLALPTTSQLER